MNKHDNQGFGKILLVATGDMRGSDWALNEPYSNVLFYSKKTSPVEEMQSLYYIYCIVQHAPKSTETNQIFESH